MSTVTVAVMTSGGDAPGMNAAVRGVFSRATEKGYRVIGIRDGYTGLLKENMFEMQFSDVENIISMGGTVLGTSRCETFTLLEAQMRAADICRKHGIDVVVVIGGDGSFHGAERLQRQGIDVIGVPGTIDLDLPCTEYTIGFDTAVNAAIEAVDRINDTSKAHHCFSVVEVMGRRAGYIAMCCGISSMASAILIPERDSIGSLIDDLRARGLDYGTIVVAEGAGRVDKIAVKIERAMNVHVRRDVLGFLQRGGAPTVRDRVTGCMMGAYAVDLYAQGYNCHTVAMQHGALKGIPLDEVFDAKHGFPDELYVLGRTICTRF